MFGTCCEGSWPMMPASGAINWWWPVLLAMLVSGVGLYLHLLCPNANTQSLRHSDNQILRHSSTRTLRHSDVQTFIEIRTFTHSNTQTLKHSHTHTFRHSDIQTFRHSDILTVKYSDIRTFAHWPASYARTTGNMVQTRR